MISCWIYTFSSLHFEEPELGSMSITKPIIWLNFNFCDSPKWSPTFNLVLSNYHRIIIKVRWSIGEIFPTSTQNSLEWLESLNQTPFNSNNPKYPYETLFWYFYWHYLRSPEPKKSQLFNLMNQIFSIMNNGSKTLNIR